MLTKPFGKGLSYPGSVGGEHCIAVDQEWLKSVSEKAGNMPEMINLARALNNGMPQYSVSILQDLLNDCGYPIRFRNSSAWSVL
jgi:UDP-N-acetyl-D-mannosaminuronate dehydrogenase